MAKDSEMWTDIGVRPMSRMIFPTFYAVTISRKFGRTSTRCSASTCSRDLDAGDEAEAEETEEGGVLADVD